MVKTTKPTRGKELPEPDEEEPSTGVFMFPVTNTVGIDVDRLAETLRRYETDRIGFFAQIPRLR